MCQLWAYTGNRKIKWVNYLTIKRKQQLSVGIATIVPVEKVISAIGTNVLQKRSQIKEKSRGHTMNEKTYFPEEPETRHKKKAKSKGLPRADHKHLYETVLLTKKYHGTDFKTGRPRITETQTPTKVCTVCGRIEHVDKDPKYYNRNIIPHLPFRVYEDELSEEALSLPKWLAEDFWDKFATKID